MHTKIALALPLALALAFPLVASAHEHATYQIGKDYYQFVVGSLNEPVAVDDKTGVDFSVSKCFTSSCAAKMGPDGDMDGAIGTPVAGLENMLKVELAAGDQKKTFSFSPVYGKAGSYSAAFYPTVATTYSYRINGTINDIPVDVTFTCAPESAEAKNDTTPKKLNDRVMQLTDAGKFGCPKAKPELGFPEPSASLAALSKSSSREPMGVAGLALGAIALALSGAALRKRS